MVSAKGLKEVVKLGLLQLDQTQARKVLVSSLRTQQQRMHHNVTQSVTLTFLQSSGRCAFELRLCDLRLGYVELIKKKNVFLCLIKAYFHSRLLCTLAGRESRRVKVEGRTGGVKSRVEKS